MQKFIRMWVDDGSSGVAHAKQKMNGMFGGMPGLDVNSVNMNEMFDNKNIDDDLAFHELSEGNDDEQFIMLI